jgi:hypothetical protein
VTKALTPAQLRQLEPRYTVAGLFESGTLGAGDETALEEISAIRSAFGRMVSPQRGWFSDKGGMGSGSGGQPVPRPLGNGRAWRRYVSWRHRWSRQVVAPHPSVPWGLTAADVVVRLVTEPVSFRDVAELTGKSSLSVVRLFVAAVQDYGAEVVRSRREFWNAWDGIEEQTRRRQVQRRRRQVAERVRRHREKKRREQTKM